MDLQRLEWRAWCKAISAEPFREEEHSALTLFRARPLNINCGDYTGITDQTVCRSERHQL